MPCHQAATRCAYGPGDCPNVSAGTCSDAVGICSKAGCAAHRLMHDGAVIRVRADAGEMEPTACRAFANAYRATTGHSEQHAADRFDSDVARQSLVGSCPVRRVNGCRILRYPIKGAE
jgi:hypothetical protein